MKVMIEGAYRSSTDPDATIYITKLIQSEWRTLYSRSGTLPNIPALSHEYRVEMEDAWEGAAYFDGKHLWGYFLPKNLSPEALADLRSLPLHFGRFAAELRDDGSFAVIIEQWDGKTAKQLGELEMIKSETEWFRSN